MAIADYYSGQLDAAILVESDCAGIERMPVGVFFRNYEQLPDLERYALSLCKGTVLDIGAGAGSHSLILQQQGYEVWAIRYLAVFGCGNATTGSQKCYWRGYQGF